MKKVNYNRVIKYNIKKLFNFINNKKNTFSIVTAVYNCENYLEKYFESIISNNYEMSKIEIILIDDGSTDNSKKIIETYKKNYPGLIKYFFQENSGQAMARNNGLKYVQNDWITFIDSDDFIGEDYFYQINKAINMYGSKQIISANLIVYNEETNDFQDNHPQNTRFKGHGDILNRDLYTDHIFYQMSVNNAFFYKDLIALDLKLKNLKPQFEDAYLVNQYILEAGIEKISFVKKAYYYYRKRASNNSTLNKSFYDKRRYVELLKEGLLELILEYKKKLGYVPNFIQNMIIYDLSWNFKELERSKTFLTNEEQKEREKYLQEIFNHIDYDNIVDNWKFFWRYYQIGINNRYYQNKKKIKSVVYYWYTTNKYHIIKLLSCEDNWQIDINSELYDLKDLEYKKRLGQINGTEFITEYYVKIPKVLVKGTKNGIRDINFYFNGQYEKMQMIEKEKKDVNVFTKESVCIFFDRIDKADDNAEILYEWFKKNKPEYKKMYFAISKKSKDYYRLKEKGFNVIDYEAQIFEEMYIKADFIFSSALDNFIENFKGLRHAGISKSSFIFLQHGITINDISKWLETKKIDAMIVSSNFEYKNIVEKYNLFEDMLITSKMPRYDKLKNSSDDENKKIIFAPTWRQELRDISVEQFKTTKYYHKIKSLLHNPKLLDVLIKYKIKFIFIPHPAIANLFMESNLNVNKNINVIIPEKIKYSEEINKANLMITDYSSVIYDNIYLKKPSIFYQYDIKNFFEKHAWEEGLNYEKDGLGRVEYEENKLIESIEYYVKNNFKLEEKYLNRIEDFFIDFENNSCEKVYEYLQKENDEAILLYEDIKFMNKILYSGYKRKKDIKEKKIFINEINSITTSYSEILKIKNQKIAELNQKYENIQINKKNHIKKIKILRKKYKNFKKRKIIKIMDKFSFLDKK